MRVEEYPWPDGALDDLELAVARRADELAHSGLCSTPLNLHCWMQAEREILDRPDALNGRRQSDASGDLPACA